MKQFFFLLKLIVISLFFWKQIEDDWFAWQPWFDDLNSNSKRDETRQDALQKQSKIREEIKTVFIWKRQSLLLLLYISSCS